jgi:hypothetical protein
MKEEMRRGEEKRVQRTIKGEEHKEMPKCVVCSV